MAPLVFHQSEHAEHAARRLSTFCLANPGVTWRPPPPPLADTSPMTRAIFTKKPNRIPRSPAARAACYQARGEKNRNQGVVMPSSRNSPTVCNWQLVLLDASTYLFFFFFSVRRAFPTWFARALNHIVSSTMIAKAFALHRVLGHTC